MAQGHFIQSKFTAGEWSPLLEGQVNLDKYRNSLYRLENFIIDPHGPLHFRPGWRYIAATKTSATKSYLVPFEFAVTQAYILEFGGYYIRFYRNQGQILSGASPYEVATPYAVADLPKLKYCQSADVLYLWHPSYGTRKLSRTGHTAWTLTTIKWNPAPIKEQGIKPAATLTLAAVTGAGILFTAGAAVFQSGDVGRLITSGAGRASIVGFTSTTQVTCDIIDDFAAVGPIASQSWSLLGSPVGTITPSISSPTGSICTLTGSGGSESFTSLVDIANPYWSASGSGTNEFYLTNAAPFYGAVKPDRIYIDGAMAVEGVLGTLGIVQWGWGDNDALGYNTIYVRVDAAGTDPDAGGAASFIQKSVLSAATTDLFRAADVGKYVRVHSGLIKITTYTSTVSVAGEIIKELEAITATTAWTLEAEVWNADNGYPAMGTFFEERLAAAGCPGFPETAWLSVTGDYENFTPGTDDADALEFTVTGRDVSIIYWLEPDEYLMAGSVSKISRVGPDDTGSALTPLNVLAKRQSPDGAADLMPIAVRNAVLYVMNTGNDNTKGLKVGEISWSWERERYTTQDMTIMAEHITGDGLYGICYQKEPYSMVWGWRTDGVPVALTYLREEDVVGWAAHPTDGIVESMATIPGDGYNEVWAVIARTVGGATVRYVEMLEKVFRDTPAEYAANKGLNAYFVDCGITYNGVAATTISGLDHLEGETVAVLADGSYAGEKVVSGGDITLSRAASVVHVGLPYTGYIQTMRLEASLPDGTVQGRIKQVDKLTFRVHSSGVFQAGRDEDNLDAVFDRERVITLGGSYPLYTGDLPHSFDDKFNREGRVMVVQDKPLPLTLVAIMAEVSL